MNLNQLLFSFQGRIGRGPFWLGTFLAWVYYALAFSTYDWLGGFSIGSLHPIAAIGSQSPFHQLVGFALLSFSLAMIVWIDLALQVKRWHDREKTGWWVMICLIPGLGLLWAIVECGLFPSIFESEQFEDATQSMRGMTAAAN